MDTQLYLHCLVICILGVNGEVQLHLTLKNTPLKLKSPGYPKYTDVDNPMTWKISASEGSGVFVYCYDFRAEMPLKKEVIQPTYPYNYYQHSNWREVWGSSKPTERWVPVCKENNYLRIETLMTTFNYSFCDQYCFMRRSEGNISIKLETKAPFRYNCDLSLIPSPINEDIPAGESSCPCGRTKKVKVSFYDEFFWSFRVFLRDQYDNIFCSGSILTKRHFLTAAHCLDGKSSGLIKVVVYRPEGWGYSVNETIQVINKHIHPEYKAAKKLNDIAILKIAKNITFGDLVGPVCLPSEQGELYSLAGQWVTAFGVDALKADSGGDYLRRRGDLVGMDYENCSQVYPDVLDITKRSQLCAISPYGDKEKCATDGPLVYLDRELNRYVQVGLTAYGEGCSTGKPNIYTDLRAHIAWIEKIISEEGMKICKKQPSSSP